MCLMAGAEDWPVGGPVVGDAARRVRVKPLSRPETRQMPPHPPDPGTPTAPPTRGGPVTGPQARWGREEPHPQGL